MAVITSDEATEAEELHYVSRGLDVLLPLAGALREYNSIVVEDCTNFVGDNLELSIGLSTHQRQVLTNFLNKLFRFPFDVVGGLRGAEFCSVSYFRQVFEAWYKDTVAGFKLDDVEQKIASAFGLSCPKTITELVADDYHGIDFQFVDASANCTELIGIVLSVRLKNTARSEPLLIPLFQNVEGFKPIDEVPVLDAVVAIAGVSNQNDVADVVPTRPFQLPFRIRLSKAEERIVEVVKRNARRLTTTQIHSALEDVEATSLGMLKQSLAFLVRIGVLDNRQDADPPGYGIGPNHGQTCEVSFG